MSPEGRRDELREHGNKPSKERIIMSTHVYPIVLLPFTRICAYFSDVGFHPTGTEILPIAFTLQ